MEIIISVVGAMSAILVAVVGAVLSNKNSNKLQLRKLKRRTLYFLYRGLA